MTSLRRRITLAYATTAAAACVLALWLLVPAPAVPVAGTWTPSLQTGHARGVYHVHTARSDGTGSVEDVARAASRAGLDFLILTDHGDATRQPDPPRYLDGVLVIDAVEISTRLGHYVALGLDHPAPFRLAGWPDDVAQDVTRFGGFGIVAHPDSPRRSLAWRDWAVDAAGLEWLNADSQWRDESWPNLARALLTYPLRPAETIVSLVDRPVGTLKRWDELSSQGRYFFGLAAADAHARLGLRDYEEDGASQAWALHVPAYEHVFRAFSTVVELEAPLATDAHADARALVEAIRRGRSYTVMDGLAAGGKFEYYARADGTTVPAGATIPIGTAVELVVRTLAPAGASLRLLRNGTPVAESGGLELVHATTATLQPGERGAAFRAEVVLGGSSAVTAAPWIVSNPIFVERPEVAGPPAASATGEPAEEIGIDLRGCLVEKDAVSTGLVNVDAGGDDLTLGFRLSEDPNGWVALACVLPTHAGPRRTLHVGLQSDVPMRLDVQLRGTGDGDLRWGRSIYVDRDTDRAVVPLGALRPVSGRLPGTPPEDASVLLLVVDRVHGTPGLRGVLRVRRARLADAPQVRTVSSR
jgi:hypothetical protein